MNTMKYAQDHPGDNVLLESIGGVVDDVLESAIVAHLDRCHECCERLERLAADADRRSTICQSLVREATATRSSDVGGWSTLEDFAVGFLQPSDHPGAIGRLGEYELLSVIGQGGMGIVFKGFQVELNRPVAIKVMSPHLATVAVARQRFKREALATAAIVHPNVMPILAVNESATQLPFLVMPFVACHSLQQRLDATGALPIVECLRIGVQVTAALAAAHKQGLVHRDVKPANILLERGIDRAMLTDFGLARAVDDATLTRTGVIAGTPGYMSPEQARGESVDARSDLFSLGSVMYAMATGQPPFRGETSYAVLRKVTDHRHQSIRSVTPSVPLWYATLVDRLLCKNAADRFGNANEVQELLEVCLTHVQQPGAKLPAELTHPKIGRRIGVIAILVVMLAILIGVMLYRPTKQAIPEFEVPAISDSLDDELRSLADDIESFDAEVTRPFDDLSIPAPTPEGNLQ